MYTSKLSRHYSESLILAIILGLESDPKSKRAGFKFILTKVENFIEKKRSQTQHIFNNPRIIDYSQDAKFFFGP